MALTACAPEATPAPTPTAIPRIGVTPGLEPRVRAWVTEYAGTGGTAEFDLVAIPAQAAMPGLRDGEFAVMIAADPAPQGWFATPLGREGILFVVPAANALRNIRQRDLAGIFAGRVTRWDALGGATGEVLPVIPLPGDDLRTLVEARLLPDGAAASYSLLADTPARIASIVAGSPNAIGYVPASQELGGLHSLSIDGLPPSPAAIESGRYPFVANLLAFAPVPPQGAVHAFLSWVQANKLHPGS